VFEPTLALVNVFPDGGASCAKATLGVTIVNGALAVPVPAAFEAVTLNVYEVETASPVTTQLSCPAGAVQVKPEVDLAVYPVIADPPSLAGASQANRAWPVPGVAAESPVGAPGAVAALTGAAIEQVSRSTVPNVRVKALRRQPR
jgi:hypothetical protein